MFLHLFPPFFLKYWFSPIPNVLFNFVCFCYLPISPSVDNQSPFFPFQPFLFQFSFLMVPLLPVCAVLCSFSHLLLVFLPSLSISPQLIPLFLLYVFNANGTTPSPMEAAGSSTWWAPTRQGKRLEKRKAWQKGEEQDRKSCGELKAQEKSLQRGSRSFPLLQCKSSAPSVQGVLSVSEQEQPGVTKVVWERDRDIKKQRQNTASIQRNRLGKGGIPIWWEERQNQKGRETQKLKEQRRQQIQVISMLWLCCIDTKNAYNQVNCHQEIFTLKGTFLAYSEMAFL